MTAGAMAGSRSRQVVGVHWSCLGTAIHKLDDALRKLRPRQQDAMAALVAAQSNVCAESRDRPLIAAARVRTTETDYVVEPEVLWRCGHVLEGSARSSPPAVQASGHSVISR